MFFSRFFSPVINSRQHRRRRLQRVEALEDRTLLAAAILDVDSDGQLLALTDGLLLIRHAAGFSGESLTWGAVSESATRQSATEIQQFLNSSLSELDFDQDGEFRALTDGILGLRFAAGFRGDALVSNAINPVGAQTDAGEIASYLESITPGGNAAPILETISDQEIDEGFSLTFTAHASDSDDAVEDLMFALDNAPGGATIDADSGEFSWVPAIGSQRGDFDVTVRVTDPAGDFATETLTVTVNDAFRIWTNPEGGDWSDSGNWLSGQIPIETDAVLINQDGDYQIELDNDISIRSFIVQTGSGQQILDTNSFNVESTEGINGGANLSVTANTSTFAANMTGIETLTVRVGHFTGSVAAETLIVQSKATFDAAAAFEVIDLNGELSGVGNVLATGVFEWVSGTISGTGVKTIGPAATLNIFQALNGDRQLVETTLRNEGTVNWTSAANRIGRIWFDTATVENVGTFVVATDDSSPLTMRAGVGISVFNNSGQFAKRGSGVARFTVSNFDTPDIHVTSSGTVSVDGGELSLSRKNSNPNVTHTGPFHVAAAAALRLDGKQSIDSLNTEGIVAIGSGLGTNVTFTGPTHIATLIAGNVVFDGATTITDATLNGELGGSGDVTFSGIVNWTQGAIGGIGVKTVSPSAALNITNTVRLDGATIRNNGIITVQPIGEHGGAGVSFGNTASIENSGQFTANTNGSRSSLSFSPSSASGIFTAGTFVNAGMFTQTGSGTVNFFDGVEDAVTFTNTGTVNVEGGTFLLNRLKDSRLFHSGDFTVDADATLQLFGDHTVNTATINGTLQPIGDVVFNNTVVVNAIEMQGTASTLLFESDTTIQGLVNLKGTISVAGDLTIANTATVNLTVARATNQSMSGRIFVTGNASLGGTLRAGFSSVFRPGDGEVFELLAYASRDGLFADFQFVGLVRQVALLGQGDLSVTATVFDIAQ